MDSSHPPGPQGQHPAMWVTQAYPPVMQAALARHGGLPVSVRQLVLGEPHHRPPPRPSSTRRWGCGAATRATPPPRPGP